MEALRTLGRPVRMHGVSNRELLDRVDLKLTQNQDQLQQKVLSVAQGIHNAPVTLRPLDALLRLSRVTALRLTPSAYHLYKWWAPLRYLGAFDSEHGALRLDRRTTTSLRQNERRIFSEEIGVGFGILIAEEWCRANGARGRIIPMDVGEMIHQHQVTTLGGRQPDYLLGWNLPGQSRLTYRAVECKGTVSESTAINQLARAVTQLDGLSLNGVGVPGVAISIVSSNDEVSYRAVDPEDTPPTLDFDPDILTKMRRTSLRLKRSSTGGIEAKEQDFLAASTMFGMAGLAQYGGATSTAKWWLPKDLQERYASDDLPQESIHYKNHSYSGVRMTLDLPGGDGAVSVFQGVDSRILEGLDSQKLEDVQTAQEELAAEDHDLPDSSTGDEEPEEVSTVSAEGAFLQIRMLKN